MSQVPGIGRDPPTAMITKLRIIGLLTILVVCFLILRPGDEPCDSDSRKGNAGSTNDRRSQSRTSDFPTLGHNRGIVSRLSTQNTPPLYDGVSQKPLSRRERGWGKGVKGQRPVPFATSSYGRQGIYPEQPYLGLDYGGYGSPDPYGARSRIHTDGYRFRPLAEQVQQQQRQAPYPSQPAYPAYADYLWEVYSFRPLEKSPGARGRWQGPHGQPDRHSDPYYLDLYFPDPWSPSPLPQWGAAPSAQRMYPSLSRNPVRRLSAR